MSARGLKFQTLVARDRNVMKSAINSLWEDFFNGIDEFCDLDDEYHCSEEEDYDYEYDDDFLEELSHQYWENYYEEHGLSSGL